MKVMAGIDTEIAGEARPADGIRIGYLPQEPQLDPAKDVAGNVFEGVAETKALLDRFEAVSNAFADVDADQMDVLIAEQSELQEKIDAARSEEHTSELQSLMRISYAVFCLKKKKQNNKKDNILDTQTTV